MIPRISVCMAIRNGEDYLHDQLASILPQLAGDDEVIVSDDHSSDRSIKIANSFSDGRIKVVRNPGRGIVSNFENSIRHSRGAYIFLADQDDVWAPDKISRTMPYLEAHALVVSDCMIVDENLRPARGSSFFDVNSSGKGIFRNILRNSYMGCCMAFHRKVADKAMPFPKRIPMHDSWLGLIAEIYFSVRFIENKLVFHRRHGANASTNGEHSRFTWGKRVEHRFWLMKEILELAYAA